jgi:hypothetical protein
VLRLITIGFTDSALCSFMDLVQATEGVRDAEF